MQLTYENTKMNESTKKNRTFKADLLYPDLSYEIVGVLFDVFTNFGYGQKEEYYQKAIAIALKEKGLAFKRELPVRINFKNKFIATNYLDFLIEGKVVLEIKQGNRFNPKDIQQAHRYLKLTDLKLGILARFTKVGVKTKRIINVD